MRIMLLRNSQHIGEVEQIVFADKKTALTSRGKQQAELLCQKLKTSNPVAIYSSDFLRAIETVQPLATQTSLEIKVSPAFRPFDVGECFGYTQTQVVEAIGAESWSEIMTGPNPSRRYFKDGETLEEQAERAWKGLKQIITKASEGSVIISTHLSVINCILCRIFQVPLNKFWVWGRDTKSPHPSTTSFIYEQGNWYLENYNYTEDFGGR